MNIRIIAFSKRGCELAEKVRKGLSQHNCAVFSKTSSDGACGEKITGPASKWVEESFKTSDAVVFIGATGIAVRYIAPFLKSKTTDPAVISMDDGGRFVISLVSGHIGGANDLADEIAKKIGATPVVTTATDVLERFAVDSFAAKNNMHISSMPLAKEISSMIVDDKKVGLASDIPLPKNIPQELDPEAKGNVGIYISYGRSDGPFKKTLKLTPRCHILGIGCRRGTPAKNISELVSEVLERENISLRSVKAAASIDLKKDEVGLLEFSEKIGIETVFFSAKELSSQPDLGYTSSEWVRSVTSVDNVCERAAVALSESGKIVVKKTSRNGVTLAIVRELIDLDFKGGY
jgi:cobalt-precorrin 5A hydrolase